MNYEQLGFSKFIEKGAYTLPQELGPLELAFLNNSSEVGQVVSYEELMQITL